MGWREEYLDLVLVPIGFIIFLGYHLLLLYRTLMRPNTTYFGSELRQRRLSLRHMFQMEAANRGAFVADMSSNITLANTYGSYSVTLISLAGGLVTISFSVKRIIYGDKDAVMGAEKCISVVVFALVAFLCFQEGAKTLGRANFLITMPDGTVQPEYINDVVVRGFAFCEVGNRSFYFSLALFAWSLGPIPMLAACLILSVGLYMKDTHTIPLEESSLHIELSPV